MTIQSGTLSEFVTWDALERKLVLDLPIEIEQDLYPIIISLDNGLITKDYSLKINISELHPPFFDELDWYQVYSIQIVQGNSK